MRKVYTKGKQASGKIRLRIAAYGVVQTLFVIPVCGHVEKALGHRKQETIFVWKHNMNDCKMLQVALL